MTMTFGFEVTTPDAPLTAILTAVSQIEGIDIMLALSRISGRQNILTDCIRQTAGATDQKLQQMSIYLSKNDLRGFYIEAHGLKNALAAIGATGHAELAASLEMAAKAGQTEPCKKEFIRFAGLVKNLAAALRAVVFQETRTEHKAVGDRAFLCRVVQEAADLLCDFETDYALDRLNTLTTFTFGDETDALLAKITDKIKAYKYDDAIRLLKRMGVGDKSDLTY